MSCAIKVRQGGLAGGAALGCPPFRDDCEDVAQWVAATGAHVVQELVHLVAHITEPLAYTLGRTSVGAPVTLMLPPGLMLPLGV